MYDVVTYNIDAIGSNEMAMTMENFRPGRKFDYNRVTTDYAAEIVGVWEGVEMTGDETYGNAEARIVYEANGKFYYFSKNDEGQWAINFKESDRKYIVDGDWLATSWKDENGNTNFECWDIDEIKGDVMKWSALREREDGTRFKTTFTWRKISNRPALVLTVGDTSIGLVFVRGGDYSMTINRDGTELKTSGTTADDERPVACRQEVRPAYGSGVALCSHGRSAVKRLQICRFEYHRRCSLVFGQLQLIDTTRKLERA